MTRPGTVVIGFVHVHERPRSFAAWVMRPGFRHVWIATRDASGYWIWMEWHAWGARAMVLPESGLLAISHMAVRRGGAVVEYEARLLKPGRRFAPGLYTCVTAVKHMVGLRCWWAWTPWLLFCALRQRGATVLMDGRKGA